MFVAMSRRFGHVLSDTSIVKPLPPVIFESIAFIAWLAAFGAYVFFWHASIHATEHQIPPRKTPLAEASGGGNEHETISH